MAGDQGFFEDERQGFFEDEQDGYEPEELGQSSTERSAVEIVKDLGVSYGVGSNALLKIAGDLYGLTTGDMENFASEQGGRGVEYWTDRKSDQLRSMEADRASKVAAADNEIYAAGTAFWETVKSPSLLSSFMVEQAPMLLPGAGVGRGAGALAKTAGLSGKVAGKVATAGAVGTGSAMQGADAGSQAYEQLMAVPQEVWDTNQDLIRRVKSGEKKNEAKEAIALELSQNAAIASGVTSVGLNMIPGARALEKQLAGVKIPGASRTSKAVLGFTGEMLQEGGEEGAGKFLANLAEAQVSDRKDLGEGVGEAAGLGAAGGFFGGIAGATAPDSPTILADEPLEKARKSMQDSVDRIEPTLGLDDLPAPLPVSPPVNTPPTEVQPDRTDVAAEHTFEGMISAFTGSVDNILNSQPTNIGVTSDGIDGVIQSLQVQLDTEINRLPMPVAQPLITPQAIDTANTAPANVDAGQNAEAELQQSKLDRKEIDAKKIAKPTKRVKFEKVKREAQYRDDPIKEANPIKPGDNIMQAIAKMGGLSRAESEAQGIDPAWFNTKRGSNNAFRVKGYSFDQMAEALSERGYIDKEYTANELVDKVQAHLAGDDQMSTAGFEIKAEREAQAAIDDANQQMADEMEADLNEMGFGMTEAVVETAKATAASFDVDWTQDVPIPEVPTATREDHMISALAIAAEDSGVDPQEVSRIINAGKGNYDSVVNALGAAMTKSKEAEANEEEQNLRPEERQKDNEAATQAEATEGRGSIVTTKDGKEFVARKIPRKNMWEVYRAKENGSAGFRLGTMVGGDLKDIKVEIEKRIELKAEAKKAKQKLKPEAKPKTRAKSASTRKMPETVSAGPMVAKVTPVNKTVYREVSPERAADMLTDISANNREKGAIGNYYVTDNKDLAIGQDGNNGVIITMNGELVSAVESYKPGTEIPGVGKEYQANYINRYAVTKIESAKPIKPRGTGKAFLRDNFNMKKNVDGTVTYTRKDAQGIEVITSRDYYATPEARSIAHKAKIGDSNAVEAMARDMAQDAPKGAIFVPVPSRNGIADDTLKMAEIIAATVDGTVSNVLVGNDRKSLYDIKADGGSVDPSFFGYSLNGALPDGEIVLVDNVYDTGSTANAAAEVTGATKILVHSEVKTKKPSDVREVKEEQGDFLGGAETDQQSLIRAARAKKEAKLTGPDVPADIDGGLFGSGQKQIDIMDAIDEKKIMPDREFEDETGDIFTVKRSASETISELNSRIDGIKKLVTCLGR